MLFYTQLLWTYLLVIFVALVFSGLGTAACKVGNIHQSQHDVFDSFWFGYAIVIFLTSLLNLFTGIDYIVSLILALPSLISFLLINKRSVSTGLQPLVFFLVLTFIILVSASFFMVQPIFDDEGGYHFPILRLMNELPALNGIVNIHHRLASPYAGINISAFMSFFPYIPREATIKLPKILLLSVVLMQLTCSAAVHFKRKETLLTAYCGLSLIVLFLNLKVFFYLGDLDVYLLSFILFYYFIRLLIYRNYIDFLAIAVLCLIATQSKLSSSLFCLTTLLLSALIYCRTKLHVIRVFYTAVLLSIMLLPYIANNVIKSGTLIFPMETTSLDVAWANPGSVKRNRISVMGWARSPGKDFEMSLQDHTSWIKPWYKKNKVQVKVYRNFLLFCLTLMLITASILPRVARKEIFSLAAILHIPILSGMLYWFFISPVWRFGGTFIGLGFAVPLALSFYGLSKIGFFNSWPARLGKSLGVSSNRTVLTTAVFAIILGTLFLLHSWTQPATIHGYAQLPTTSIETHHTPKGKKVFFNSNKNHGNCYDTSRLPCGQNKWSITHVEWLGEKLTDGFVTIR